MPTTSNIERELVQQWYQARNQHDWSVIDDLLHDSFVFENIMLGITLSGRREYLEYCRDFDNAFSDERLRLERMISAPGGLFVVELTITGIQTGPFGVFPPSGEHVIMQFCDVLKLETGKVTNLRTYGDLYRPLSQMHHVVMQEKRPAA